MSNALLVLEEVERRLAEITTVGDARGDHFGKLYSASNR